jgi:hypothetical protein
VSEFLGKSHNHPDPGFLQVGQRVGAGIDESASLSGESELVEGSGSPGRFRHQNGVERWKCFPLVSVVYRCRATFQAQPALPEQPTSLGYESSGRRLGGAFKSGPYPVGGLRRLTRFGHSRTGPRRPGLRSGHNRLLAAPACLPDAIPSTERVHVSQYLEGTSVVETQVLGFSYA